MFPIEFRQMARARVVLYGPDPFESLRLSDKNLRHQTEYELRGKLLQLRRLYVTASISAERLRDLMADSLSSFAVLFAPVLQLHGEESPVLKRDVVRATARLLGLDLKTFERVFALRESAGRDALDDREADQLFTSYMAQIERVIESVDRLDLSGRE